MTETKKELPSRPSELIELALEDLEKVEKDPRYVVDMSSWHETHVFGETPVCAVCLAGSVMAKTLGCDVRKNMDPSDLCGVVNADYYKQLKALDAFRLGNVRRGLKLMDCEIPASLPRDAEITPYSSDYSEQFKQSMRRLAAELREHGL